MQRYTYYFHPIFVSLIKLCFRTSHGQYHFPLLNIAKLQICIDSQMYLVELYYLKFASLNPILDFKRIVTPEVISQPFYT